MGTYDSLDINAKINLKGALADWSKYAVERFQDKITKNVYGVYGVKTTKKGVMRTSLGKQYRFGGVRTGSLKKNWWRQSSGSRVVLEFLLYGRFVDMGVGRGVSHTDRLVSRKLREGPTSRQARRWYSKTKTHQIIRLREILAQRHVSIPVDSIETLLTIPALKIHI